MLIEPGAIKTEIWAKGRDEANEVEAQLDPAAVVQYQAHIDMVRRLIDHQDRVGIPAEKVARIPYALQPQVRGCVLPPPMSVRAPRLGLGRFDGAAAEIETDAERLSAVTVAVRKKATFVPRLSRLGHQRREPFARDCPLTGRAGQEDLEECN